MIDIFLDIYPIVKDLEGLRYDKDGYTLNFLKSYFLSNLISGT